ncbi:hypothetical protein ONS96_007200 [Cadophora gregata f. sp. sojae]|nr:hypothetical protein ONS96_007200 [Cadophora gregata f. sp. sojae]
MCQIFNYSVCGHREIDKTGCNKPGPKSNFCNPTLYALKGKCTDCRQEYLEQVARRPSVDFHRATRIAREQTMISPSRLAASPNIKQKFTRKSRRRVLLNKPLPPIPENSSPIVREERGWKVGVGKPLPSQPYPIKAVRIPNWETSSEPVMSTSSVHGSLAVATTAYVTRYAPPHKIVSIPQPKVSAPSALKTSMPQNTVRNPLQLSEESRHPLRPHPVPPVTSVSQDTAIDAPEIELTIHRLQSWETLNIMRAAFDGTKVFHIPAVSPPNFGRKVLPNYVVPAYMTLPSQVAEPRREADEAWQRLQAEWSPRSPTTQEELFLEVSIGASMKEGTLSQGGLPSSLTPPAPQGKKSLTRISTTFNRFSVTGDELSHRGDSPANKTYTAYLGAAPKTKSTPENPLMSYAAHQARRTMTVGLDSRNQPAAPNYRDIATLNTVLKSKYTSRVQPHYVPDECMPSTPRRSRFFTTEDSQSKLLTTYKMTPTASRQASSGFVSANSNRNTSTTISQGNGKGRSISELSENLKLAVAPYDGTLIELEAQVPMTILTQECKMSARLTTVGIYDRWDLVEPAPCVVA